MGPVAIPPRHKPEIIALRKRIEPARRGIHDLREYDLETREIYLGIAHALLNPRMPELRNTDGDPIELHTLIYDLDQPEAAASALRDLTGDAAEPEMEYDEHGAFLRAQIAWTRAGNATQKNWESTTLGFIRISGARLTAEVNSQRRAVALRKLIEQRLGETAHVRPALFSRHKGCWPPTRVRRRKLKTTSSTRHRKCERRSRSTCARTIAIGSTKRFPH